MLALGRDLDLLGGVVGQPLGARALEEVVVAGVGHELLLVDVHDVVAHVVQQVAVVAYHQDCVAELLQMLRQPDHGFDIEMVRRLVEDQEVGVAEQRARECHAHAPAARERAAGPLLRVVVEAEAGQDRGGARGRGGGLDLVEAHMDVGQAQAVLGGLGLGKQRGPFDVGRQHGVDHLDVAARRVLRHRADAGAAHQVDVTRVGLVLALDDLEQGRFACAVAADQANLPAVGESHRGAVEQDALAVAKGEIGDAEHGARACSTACRALSRRL